MIIDFDLELARAIIKGTKEGSILTKKEKKKVFISSFGSLFDTKFPVEGTIDGCNSIDIWTEDGSYFGGDRIGELDLIIELPDPKINNSLIEFDIDTAKLALLVGTGEIITRTGIQVEIYDWNVTDNGKYPIIGLIEGFNALNPGLKKADFLIMVKANMIFLLKATYEFTI